MKAQLVLLQALVCFCVCVCTAERHSWCDPKLCTDGSRHIACHNKGGFNRRCKPDSVEIDVSAYKSAFVHAHNKRRNFLALGLLPGYYPAARMATMVWDDELQHLANLNLRTCILDHDDCHNTYRYANSGQNLCAVHRDRNPHTNVTNIIDQVLSLWFDEYPLIDSTYITKFRVSKHFEDYGHFAEMVVDKNYRVGCGIIRFTRPDVPTVYIYNVVCNYASIYALDAPVYRVGYPASKCSTGRNKFYPGLCSTKEEYNPNW